MNKEEIFGLSLKELKEKISSLELPAFKATQLAKWMYARGVWDFAEMSDLSKSEREMLAQNFIMPPAKIKKRLTSDDGQTDKFLLEFNDGHFAETVLMRTNYGASVCISSQAGCAMGCKFCASTLLGLERNLTAGEMLAQAVHASSVLATEGTRLSHIVVMGSGEPLANFENLTRFLELAHADYSLGISYRHITVSTCGLVPEINQMLELKMPVNLAISLHAATDELRSSLMPINNRYPLAEVLEAANNYANATHRQVTYEYILLAGVNDGLEHASELALLLKDKLAYVNLIPMNAAPEREFTAPSNNRIHAFSKALTSYGIANNIRHERGAEVNAACGQLRAEQMKK